MAVPLPFFCRLEVLIQRTQECVRAVFSLAGMDTETIPPEKVTVVGSAPTEPTNFSLYNQLFTSFLARIGGLYVYGEW